MAEHRLVIIIKRLIKVLRASEASLRSSFHNQSPCHYLGAGCPNNKVHVSYADADGLTEQMHSLIQAQRKAG